MVLTKVASVSDSSDSSASELIQKARIPEMRPRPMTKRTRAWKRYAPYALDEVEEPPELKRCVPLTIPLCEDEPQVHFTSKRIVIDTIRIIPTFGEGPFPGLCEELRELLPFIGSGPAHPSPWTVTKLSWEFADIIIQGIMSDGDEVENQEIKHLLEQYVNALVRWYKLEGDKHHLLSLKQTVIDDIIETWQEDWENDLLNNDGKHVTRVLEFVWEYIRF